MRMILPCLLVVCVAAAPKPDPLQIESPATQPSTQRSNGLGMTDAQIQARMDEMNRKPRSDIVWDRLATDDDMAARRVSYASNQLRQAQAKAAANYARCQAAITQANTELPKLSAELAAVQKEGQAAEGNLRDALTRYNLSTALFNSVGRSFFQGETHGMSESGYWSSTFTGTVSDFGAQADAIMKIEGEYGPELRKAREKVGDLFNQQKRILSRGAQLSLAARNAQAGIVRAQREFEQATVALEQLNKPATMPSTKPQ